MQFCFAYWKDLEEAYAFYCSRYENISFDKFMQLPLSEFNKRLDEEIKFCLKINPDIKVIHDEYVYDDYLNAIKGKYYH